MPLLVRRPGVKELREVGGEVVLVHDGHLLALNRVGTQIWEILSEPRTAEDVIQAVSRDWPEAAVDGDVRPFLAQLSELGLVSES